MFNPKLQDLTECLQRQAPDACAEVWGVGGNARVNGTVKFTQTRDGVLVCADICGLPGGRGPCGWRIFAFHIHEGCACAGNAVDPLAQTGGHYNPDNCPHPEHAGDLPPLFGNNGRAWSAFLTNRFSVDEVIGRTVVIHNDPDDFTTQPAGNSGKKIACGVIKRFRRGLFDR